MSFAEVIYNNSPIFLQNLLISAYGYRVKRQRFSGHYKHYYNALRDSQYLCPDELIKLQNKLFKNIVCDYVINVPFYKQIIEEQSVAFSEININNFSSIFPVISKENVRKSLNDFVCTNIRESDTVTINTSGTSGTPLNIKTTTSALQLNYAFFNRYLNWAGVTYSDRSATFAGRVFIPNKQNMPPYWRYNRASNTLLFSAYNISENTIPEYIRALQNFDPVFIDSYPSAIYEIARYIVQSNTRHNIKPKCIITSSETLFEHQRETIEKAFNCGVYDHLGSAEMVALISQCEHKKYHINSEYGIVEVLDDNDNPVIHGTAGRLVCTSLVNPVMPLIRYDLGDTILTSSNICECGRYFPVVDSIIGRTDDIIIGCEGQKVGRLDPIFKGLSAGIKETQIIQTDRNNITIKIVKDSNYNISNTNHLLTKLSNRVGDCMKYHVEYIDSIPKSSSGKFKSVVSHVSN